ncbi:hypothetical protein DPMN_014098 [Dreissena polymorpha]|uniref:Uncharacterized protein n=1 Tax=Dreissena polymorpha TaxID=45954 RepID=A0A9D4N6M9_DREPO|nr:hypothetical protein DPMN_014098 [Dreissena polymorpha]
MRLFTNDNIGPNNNPMRRRTQLTKEHSGRPDNRSVSLRIEWEEEELVNLINESYPVLADKQFMFMIGAAWNRNLPLPQLTTHRIKDARASRLALLWVLPAKGVTAAAETVTDTPSEVVATEADEEEETIIQELPEGINLPVKQMVDVDDVRSLEEIKQD